MTITIESSFTFQTDHPVDVLLQFEAAPIPEQILRSTDTRLSDTAHFARVPAHDGIGDRLWVRADGRFEVGYSATVAVDRLAADLPGLHALEPGALPGEAVQYLFDSRYCPATRFQNFVEDAFAAPQGGEKIAAMCAWIADKLRYTPGASGADTTALDSFTDRRGICRDYAHLMVSFARAAAIPARFVSCYGIGVEPQDFHAVAEVFLEDATTPGGGAWYLVDATKMADPAGIVKIGVGRDAADVSFMSSFGPADFLGKDIAVRAV